ncbi:Peptidyl-prolyl cis-trans isomerase (rotamase) - cyclophilin family [endosymbiont of Ridgeia piscesae]|jgi:cyclophilin family peptidyl-prolyl cis-trans isomerase|nr:Peptidyl-prolyl cis-trans isomerase (rotamase) - cyclophilin family [endosymbiont of Ridgeia piscesae]KRT58959.1 peptidyl-prolyl cis-trans isomerase A (cyclophilin A) [endosymbiont of Ridgeia piscesae]
MKRIFLGLILGMVFLTAGEAIAADSKPVTVEMQTNLGTITLELNATAAPQSVENFVQYAEEGFYNGTIFHRVIKNFMIQGGGFSPDMQRKSTRDPIRNEAKNGLKNSRGSIAMARTSAAHSATAQFFINLKDNSFLDYPGQDGWGYCVFGKVTSGMDVVDKIAQQPTTRKNGMRDVPANTVIIEKVSVSR